MRINTRYFELGLINGTVLLYYLTKEVIFQS